MQNVYKKEKIHTFLLYTWQFVPPHFSIVYAARDICIVPPHFLKFNSSIRGITRMILLCILCTRHLHCPSSLFKALCICLLFSNLSTFLHYA